MSLAEVIGPEMAYLREAGTNAGIKAMLASTDKRSELVAELLVIRRVVTRRRMLMEHRLESVVDSNSLGASDVFSRARSSSSVSDRSATAVPPRDVARHGKEVLRKDSSDGVLFEDLDAFSIDDDANNSFIGVNSIEPSGELSSHGAPSGKSLATLMHQQQLKKGQSEEPLEGLEDLYAAAGFSGSGLGIGGAEGSGKGSREGAAKGFRGKGKMSALQTLLARKGSEDDASSAPTGGNEGAGYGTGGGAPGSDARTIVVRLRGSGIPNFHEHADAQPLVAALKGRMLAFEKKEQRRQYRRQKDANRRAERKANQLRSAADGNGEANGVDSGGSGLQAGLDGSFDDLGGDSRDSALFFQRQAAAQDEEEAQHFLPDESEVFGRDEVPVASRLWPWLTARGDLEPLSKGLARRAKLASPAAEGKSRSRAASVAFTTTPAAATSSEHGERTTVSAVSGEEVPPLRPSEVAPVLASALAPDLAEFAPERCATGDYVSWPVDEQADSTNGGLIPTTLSDRAANSFKKDHTYSNAYSNGTAPLAGPGDIERATQAHLEWVMTKDDYLAPAATSRCDIYDRHGSTSTSARGKVFPGILSGKGSGKRLHSGSADSSEAPAQTGENTKDGEGAEQDREGLNNRARTTFGEGAPTSGQNAEVYHEEGYIEAPTSNPAIQGIMEEQNAMPSNESRSACASGNSVAARLLSALIRVPPESSAATTSSHDMSSMQEEEEATPLAAVPPLTETFALEAQALRQKCRTFKSKDLRATAELYLAGLIDASTVTEAMQKEEEVATKAAAAAAAAAQRSADLGETTPVSVAVARGGAVTPAWAHGAHLPVGRDRGCSSSNSRNQFGFLWVPVEAGRSSLSGTTNSSTSTSTSCKFSVSGSGGTSSTTRDFRAYDVELRRLEAKRASVVRQNNQRTAKLRHRAQRNSVSSSWVALDECDDKNDDETRSNFLKRSHVLPGALILEQSEANVLAEVAREAAVLERYSRLAKRQQALKKKEENRSKATWPPIFLPTDLSQSNGASQES